MSEVGEPLLDDPPEIGREPVFKLDELMRESVSRYGEPNRLISEIVVSATNEQLIEIVSLIDRVDDVVREHLQNTDDEKCWTGPLQADFTKAQVTEDGKFKVPVADRHSLYTFLDNEDVAEALENNYSSYPLEGDPEMDLEKENGAFPAKPDPEMDKLPVNFESMSEDQLFAIAGAYYWSEQGPEKYISPANTLEDIAKDTPSQLLLPLIIGLEDHFPIEVDPDGCYIPIVHGYAKSTLMVESGVVWQVFEESDLRHELELACMPSEPALGHFSGFSGDRFEEGYCLTLERLSYSEDNDGWDVVEAFGDEQTARYRNKWGWLFEMGNKV